MHLKSIVVLAAVIPAAFSRPTGTRLSNSEAPIKARDTENGVFGKHSDSGDLSEVLQKRDSNVM